MALKPVDMNGYSYYLLVNDVPGMIYPKLYNEILLIESCGISITTKV